jgi:CRISPR/Cas system-associated endonuclease Cas1
MATPTFDRDTILRVVATWQRDEQLALAEAILRHALSNIPPNVREEPLAQPDTYRLTGIFAREGQTPPDDATVARWLDEHKIEKYGG